MQNVNFIVTCYKKENYVEDILLIIDSIIKQNGLIAEVIYVFDGSLDQATELELKKKFDDFNFSIKLIKHEKNLGKGAAQKSALKMIKYPMVVMMDGDTDIDYLFTLSSINTLLSKLNDSSHKVSLLAGSKFHRDSILKYPWVRTIVSKLFTIICNSLIGKLSIDTQTGLKIFNSEYLKNIEYDHFSNGFLFDYEFLLKLSKISVLQEFPVKIDYKYTSSINVKSTLKIVFEILSIRKRHRA